MKVNRVRGAIYARFKDIAQLADVLSWSRQKLSALANGVREPSLNDIQLMAKAMEMDVELLASFFLELQSQKCDRTLKKQVLFMATVRVHHPDLTKEEKKTRVEEIKKALIEFYKECNNGK